MKKFIFILLLSSFSISALSQQSGNTNFQYKNSIQLDLGGHGLIYSLSYERVLVNGSPFKTAAQAGIAYYPDFIGIIELWIPVGINEMYSLGNHHFEAGVGVVPVYLSTRNAENIAIDWQWSGFLSFRVGYRYQKPDGRFIFRAGFTPDIESGLFENYFPRKLFQEFHPLGGVSIGYCL